MRQDLLEQEANKETVEVEVEKKPQQAAPTSEVLQELFKHVALGEEVEAEVDWLQKQAVPTGR